MSLFFYGAVEVGTEAAATAAQIDLIGKLQGWTLNVETTVIAS